MQDRSLKVKCKWDSNAFTVIIHSSKQQLNEELHSEDFETILVLDYSSTCPKKRYDYIRGLAVPVKCVPLVEITCILFRKFLKAWQRRKCWKRTWVLRKNFDKHCLLTTLMLCIRNSSSHLVVIQIPSLHFLEKRTDNWQAMHFKCIHNSRRSWQKSSEASWDRRSMRDLTLTSHNHSQYSWKNTSVIRMPQLKLPLTM